MFPVRTTAWSWLATVPLTSGREVHWVKLTPEGHRDLCCIVDGMSAVKVRQALKETA